jgi:ATP-dependent Lon protease
VDENGDNRPFSFIAIGGSSNGSTLEGHNYTYVGSTWGRVVDILMEQKCMNPIIFIDEIDKVSKTENGREIISIMTHLVDPTQNDSFQDKYFSGIDIDVSKILFVFSYNDVSLIDRILLDRIHRIKFDNLTMDDKLVICNKHMLPELFEKMGQTGNIEFPENVLKYIINSYTLESGVRKLKELLYEIIGEINLKMLNDESDEIDLPIVVTEGDVTNVYLKDHHKMNEKKVTPIDKVGIICGLYANALGRGGVIPIETRLFVTKNLLDLKLTGQQGDVMKESMTVAKTLAWSLTSPTRQNYLLGEFENTSNQGIHIHCPEGATPKDGPSAGTAITVAIYSLLNNKPIKYDLAITGEINLQGCVTAIGGLDLKIIGGINAGVKTFLFPNENKKDFNKFMDKYHGNSIIDGIEFHGIDSIEEALKLSLVS